MYHKLKLRLKNFSDIDKWSSLNLGHSVSGMPVARERFGCTCAVVDGSNCTLSPGVKGDIALSINVPYKSPISTFAD